jgi:hypothetical protein
VKPDALTPVEALRPVYELRGLLKGPVLAPTLSGCRPIISAR